MTPPPSRSTPTVTTSSSSDPAPTRGSCTRPTGAASGSSRACPASGRTRPRSRSMRPAGCTSPSTATRSSPASSRSTTRPGRGGAPRSPTRTSTAPPPIVVMPDGSARIAFARYAPGGAGHPRRQRRHAGRPVGHRAPHQRLRRRAVDGRSGRAARSTLAFVRFEAEGRASTGVGSRGLDRHPARRRRDRDFDRPSLAIRGDGRVAIAYARSPTRTATSTGIFVARQRADGWWRCRPAGHRPSGRPDDWPSLALDSAGSRARGVRRARHGTEPRCLRPRCRHVRPAGRVDRGQRRVDDRGRRRPSHRLQAPLGDGDRGIRTGRQTNGTWRVRDGLERPVRTQRRRRRRLARPHLHGRIRRSRTRPDRGWRRRSGIAARDVPLRSRADPSGRTPSLAFTDTAGAPAIASDRDGRLADGDRLLPQRRAVGRSPADADGRIHWVIAGDAGLDVPVRAGPGRPVDGDAARRARGRPEHRRRRRWGAVHIVWRRTTSDEGTYHTTDASGSWVTTRLTRTSAEGAAGLALDAPATSTWRSSERAWAATPGRLPAHEPDRRLVDDADRRGVRRHGPAARRLRDGRATVVLGRGRGRRAPGPRRAISPAGTVDARRAGIQEIDVGERLGRDRTRGRLDPGLVEPADRRAGPRRRPGLNLGHRAWWWSADLRPVRPDELARVDRVGRRHVDADLAVRPGRRGHGRRRCRSGRSRSWSSMPGRRRAGLARPTWPG